MAVKTAKVSQVYLYATAVISLMVFLVYLSTGMTGVTELRRGMKMPPLEYLSEKGLIRLKPDTVQYKLVILFNRDCRICTGQINDLDKKYILHTGIDVIYITTDVQFLIAGDSKHWQNLRTNKRVCFGVVRQNDFREYFGSIITPSYYLFDQSGILVWMANGKVPLEQINDIMLRSVSG